MTVIPDEPRNEDQLIQLSFDDQELVNSMDSIGAIFFGEALSADDLEDYELYQEGIAVSASGVSRMNRGIPPIADADQS